MSIEVLPARLANQIAAGEVVERPASVVKELVENSLDAGATQLRIEIEKGGAKRIKITDNGSGIVKGELTLALSRHATSKIKNLDDLEAISSLGFRGEALASISSVARLTLTSKPADQEQAWQAMAEGRDMAVAIQPAAHPNGTTIDVCDLFFNTPARRKFLRTEKTEFAHIEEVIKRIALARFDASFTLTHNGKVIKQYRAAKESSQYAKRVAQVCGPKFIEHAVEVNCVHDGMELVGWLAQPSYYRNQNDLSYSYVNGRMMRDKLINHAIRQAYGELLPHEGYPAFVLFFTLDFKEVDVNVHPAKHEVRFHQARYVHDFILSVCQRALHQELNFNEGVHEVNQPVAQADISSSRNEDYVKPLIAANQGVQDSQTSYRHQQAYSHHAERPSKQAASNYQALMTPIVDSNETEQIEDVVAEKQQFTLASQQGLFVAPHYAVISVNEEVRLLSLKALAIAVNQAKITELWPQGLTSQPLLLPVKLPLSSMQMKIVEQYQDYLAQSGIVVELMNKAVQVRQFPALLRQQDVSQTLVNLLNLVANQHESPDISTLDSLTSEQWCQLLSELMLPDSFSQSEVNKWLTEGQIILKEQFRAVTLLNSAVVDLTSAINQLN